MSQKVSSATVVNGALRAKRKNLLPQSCYIKLHKSYKVGMVHCIYNCIEVGLGGFLNFNVLLHFHEEKSGYFFQSGLFWGFRNP